MSDVFLNWGDTLMLSPTGDIAVSSGTQYGQQRVIRRLLTNPLDYVWHTDYGAGLPAMVGEVVNPGQISGIIQSQMQLEQVVDQSTPPVITVSSTPDGTVNAEIQYADADTNDTSILTLPL